MTDIVERLRYEAVSKEVGMLEQGSHASERYRLLMEAAAEIAQLRGDNASTLEYPRKTRVGLEEAAAEIARMRAEAADRTKKVECLWALSDARGAEIERLQSCLYAQESVPQLYAEIKRLRLAGDAAFHAMCAYRDSRDEEVFQGAIDELGSALKDTTPRHEPKTKASGG